MWEAPSAASGKWDVELEVGWLVPEFGWERRQWRGVVPTLAR
jgi:hypothetical protein